MKEAVRCGGSITGEHGIGLTKKSYLSLMFSNEDLTIMKKIKQAFDPNNLLNPGKYSILKVFLYLKICEC